MRTDFQCFELYVYSAKQYRYVTVHPVKSVQYRHPFSWAIFELASEAETTTIVIAPGNIYDLGRGVSSMTVRK